MYRVYWWFPLTLIIWLAAACVPLASNNQMTLATWVPGNAEAFTNATVGAGRLDITAGCIRLILDNQKIVLPVWPEPTTWNASSQLIDFTSVLGERTELHNGDQIIPSGSAANRTSEFVVAPDPSCEADEIFMVNSIHVVEQ